ncbi:Phosphatidylserine decarboxylase proenzyme 3 [Grifola frondosa]|uniref:Phosphatidylserine decarboxylase proenzyme 3 n=1 Tax=Grifola frondosa TaxID=5627 RepID=A0A1C7LZF2_GRIFR|nr:Phosphatidylserine decarboxylase proenzyme 3 [Grifola frondosa]
MVDLFHQIFLQVSDENQVKDFDSLLYILDIIVVQPPKYFIAKEEDGNEIGEPIGVPMFLVFDLLSNTSAAFDLFRMPAFNMAMKSLLDSWGEYLTTEDSNRSLNNQDEGWFSDAALTSLEEGRGIFNETYRDTGERAARRRPEKKHVIHNACESTVYRIAYNVQAHDQFWLKGQAYSLYDMLDRDAETATKFVGGTIYQAFLSPFDYHRWRSPVDGVISRVVNVPGTYYAVLPDGGADPDDPDFKPGDPHGALIRSQAWLTISAARALIFIEADNRDIGLMCFVGVGMVEVSTCETKVTFADNVAVDQHLLVNSIIAQVEKA